MWWVEEQLVRAPKLGRRQGAEIMSKNARSTRRLQDHLGQQETNKPMINESREQRLGCPSHDWKRLFLNWVLSSEASLLRKLILIDLKMRLGSRDCAGRWRGEMASQDFSRRQHTANTRGRSTRSMHGLVPLVAAAARAPPSPGRPSDDVGINQSDWGGRRRRGGRGRHCCWLLGFRHRVFSFHHDPAGGAPRFPP